MKIWTLPNSAMAVAEANYGRVEQSLEYIKAIAAQLDLEMPGSLPEILPNLEYNAFADLREREMFMQAWSSYGIQWPIIYHFLGIRPDIPADRLSVIPQVPPSWPGLSVQKLHVANGTIAASATQDGKQFTTTVLAPTGWRLTLGHVLPRNAVIEVAKMDGVVVAYTVVDTLRGRELHVETTTDRSRTLLVKIK